ncbi:MAG: acyltransferase family protein [Eubacteriales bacterium]|nr:acyltransferase family protein [Eubacteriales bacterium]
MQEKRFQNRITLFTFALTILVIWVHSVNLEPEMLEGAGLFVPRGNALYAAMLSAERFLTNALGQMAVPGFFIVSGYLFFRNAPQRFSALWIVRKWRSRLFSVLLPYLVWNGIYYLGRILLGSFAGGGDVFLRLQEALSQMDGQDVFSALFLYAYNPVFWYLKQLLVLFLLTPFLWLLLKRRVIGAVMLPAFLFMAGFWSRIPVHPVNEDALFYFAAGAYAALSAGACRTELPDRSKKDAYDRFAKRGDAAIPVVLTALFLISAFCYALSAGHSRLLPLRFRSGEFLTLFLVLTRALFTAAAYAALRFLSEREPVHEKNGRLRAFLERDSLPGFMHINFFIYATHYIPVRAVNRFMLSVLPALSGSAKDAVPASAAGGAGMLFSEVLLFLVYLLLPILCTALAFAASLMLKRLLPPVWRVLSGGR